MTARAELKTYVAHPDRRIALEIPEPLAELRSLPGERAHWTSDEFPFVLAAAERRSTAANTSHPQP